MLELLRAEYGDELAAILFAVGQVESRLNPYARAVNDREDSRGMFQVNTKAWGDDAAPFDTNLPPVELTRLQIRAMRRVVDDAAAGARDVAELAGVPFAEAFNLTWQYGRGGAARVARAVAGGIIGAIAELYGDVRAAAFQAREAAFRAALALAWTMIRNAVAPVALLGGSTLVLLLVAVALASSRR